MTNTTNIKQNNLSIVMALAITTLLSLAFVLLLSPTKASAATITVGGACTLDDAVASMNAGSDQSGCTGTGAYGSGDTITLPAGTFPYGNTNTIAVPLIIQGAGMGETIVDAEGTNEGFHFSNPGATPLAATVRDLSIANPHDTIATGSGAITASDYSLIVERVEVYADTAQLAESIIVASHDIDGLTSIFRNIYIHDITVIQGAVSIYTREGATSEGNLISGLTVSDLTITASAGALTTMFATYDNGGTISGTLENATFTNVFGPNAASIVYFTATADSSISGGNGIVDAIVRNVTVKAETTSGSNHVPVLAVSIAPGGSSASASVDFQNILGANIAAIGGTFTPGAGGTETATLTSLGGNITDGADPLAVLTQPTDQSGVTGLASTLGSLQDNGGITPTIALLSGSPAIDGGVANSLTSDQRGTSRPQGSGYDSGAFELAAATEQPGTDTTDSEAELANTGQNRAILIALAAVLALPATFLVGRRLFAGR